MWVPEWVLKLMVLDDEVLPSPIVRQGRTVGGGVPG